MKPRNKNMFKQQLRGKVIRFLYWQLWIAFFTRFMVHSNGDTQEIRIQKSFQSLR